MEINLGNLYRQRQAESRSLSAENFRGEKGKAGMATEETTLHPGSAQCARELGQGWKVSPCLHIPAGETVALMDNEGPGVIRHVWITLDSKFYRNIIIRIYWDGQDSPSVECPIGDFFCCSWNQRQAIVAQPINVNSTGGMNCFFPMPFRKHARITIQNDSPNDLAHFFYTINYTLEPVTDDALYFHAQWRRTNPLPYGTDYTLVDGIKGQGAVCWNLHVLAAEQRGLVGRRRDQNVPRWRRPVPNYLWNRNGRLLPGSVVLLRWELFRAACRLSVGLRRSRNTRRAPHPVSLSRVRSGVLQVRPAGHHAGHRLAK